MAPIFLTTKCKVIRMIRRPRLTQKCLPVYPPLPVPNVHLQSICTEQLTAPPDSSFSPALIAALSSFLITEISSFIFILSIADIRCNVNKKVPRFSRGTYHKQNFIQRLPRRLRYRAWWGEYILRDAHSSYLHLLR